MRSLALAVALCACGGPVGVAVIQVSQSCTTDADGESCFSNVSASFFPTTASTSCQHTSFGQCELSECDFSKENENPTVPPAQVNGGEIAINGLRGGPVVLSFLGGRYTPLSMSARAWSGGETIMASGTGATAPAFANLAVVAPSEVTLTSPKCVPQPANPNLYPGIAALVDPLCGQLSRSSDLSVEWSGPPAAPTLLTLTSGVDGKIIGVSCRFTASPGVVPAAAMKRLGTGGKLTFGPAARSEQLSGGWELRLHASLGGRDSGTFTTSD